MEHQSQKKITRLVTTSGVLLNVYPWVYWGEQGAYEEAHKMKKSLTLEEEDVNN